jgi:thioesterase domain-containing protein
MRVIVFPGLSGLVAEVEPLVAALQAHPVQVIRYPDWPSLRGLPKAGFMTQIQAQIGSFEDVTFCGYSFGGLVALALVMEQLAVGGPVPVLGLLDTPASPNYRLPPPATLRTRMLRGLQEGAVLSGLCRRLSRIMIRLDWPLDYARHLPRRAELSMWLQCGHTWPILQEFQNAMADIATPLPMRAVLFRCVEQASEVPDDLGWRALIRDVRVIPIPCHHKAITQPAYAPILATSIAASDWLA